MQILNVSANHWITISTIGIKPGCVNIFNSIPHGSVPYGTKEQFAAILCSEQDYIRLTFKKVQLQHGHADCSGFAVAFTTALCSGVDPTEVNLVQHRLRVHLQECLEKGSMTHFPHTDRKIHYRGKERTETFKVHCVCQQPEGGKMIQCNECSRWFHSLCVTTSSTVWRNIDPVWSCASCS